MKILITSGATREPIDEVRFVSNLSSGRTGATLAGALAELGHAVVLLRGPGSASPGETVEQEEFGPAEDLLCRLRDRLDSGKFDAAIMAAAVADYRPAESASGKLSSRPETLDLRLVRTPKILPQLKRLARGPLRVAGFKLTVGADAGRQIAAVREQFSAGGVDLVVHNDLAEIRAAKLHPFQVYRAAEGAPERCAGTAELAQALHRWLAS